MVQFRREFPANFGFSARNDKLKSLLQNSAFMESARELLESKTKDAEFYGLCATLMSLRPDMVTGVVDF